MADEEFSSIDTGETPTARYRLPPNLSLVREISTGAAATVVLARDTALKRLVAVKFLSSALARDARVRGRFVREARAAARLTHDNITTVFTVGSTRDDAPFIAMQYVDGVNLRDLLKARGTFSIEDVINTISQLASALTHAHSNNIVHRDVAPENILIESASNRALLTDFGVAAILETGGEEVTRLTREGERFGNPRYMSPEQLLGMPLTGQSDVYSLGVIAFEMLCGRGPFDDEETGDIASAHLRAVPPDASAIRNDVPHSLASLLKRCLAKEPQHRPRPADIVAQLRDAEKGAAESEPGSPLRQFLKELRQRNVYKAAAAYAAVAFLVLQVADLVMPAWPQLEWLYRFIIVMCLAGFPVAIVVSWFFDLRYWRLVRTDAPRERQPRRGVQRRVLLGAGLGLSVLLTLLAAWLILGK